MHYNLLRYQRAKITPKGVLGFLSKGLKGTKELSIFSITSVQLKEASLLVNGYIQFSIPGGNESKKGIFDAVSDENTFMFSKGVNNNHQARVIKEYVFSEMKKTRSPQSVIQNNNLADELEKLKAFKDQGVLSEDEFQSAKKKLLS